MNNLAEKLRGLGFPERKKGGRYETIKADITRYIVIGKRFRPAATSGGFRPAGIIEFLILEDSAGRLIPAYRKVPEDISSFPVVTPTGDFKAKPGKLEDILGEFPGAEIIEEEF